MTGNEPIEEVLADQLRYYRARAPIYDTTYQRSGDHDRGPEANAAWRADLQVVADRLAAARLSGHVLELGCGTGHWTEQLAPNADQVTAIDGAEEMVTIASERLGRFLNVELQVQEIIDGWQPPAETYDGFAAFFFIEHVPDERLEHLLQRVASSLRPGATIFVADGAPRPDQLPDQIAAVETRRLNGCSYRVVERRRSATELCDVFAQAGMRLDVETVTQRFSIARGTFG